MNKNSKDTAWCLDKNKSSLEQVSGFAHCALITFDSSVSVDRGIEYLQEYIIVYKRFLVRLP